MSNHSPEKYLDLKQTSHASLFDGITHVWEALSKIKGYLQLHLTPGCESDASRAAHIGERVYIGAGTKISPGVVIEGPAWIGANCDLRPGAYIRENVIIGDGCVIGNSCEFKNAFLFNGCQIPHYTYVGDSILGFKAHLGAGVICSNFKLTGDEITVRDGETVFKTGLRKFGAIVGDRAEVGCHTVLNPGSLIGRDSLIYSGVQWRGILPERHIVKPAGQPYVVRAKR